MRDESTAELKGFDLVIDPLTDTGDERNVVEISTRSAGGDQAAVNAIVEFVGNGAIRLHICEDADYPFD